MIVTNIVARGAKVTGSLSGSLTINEDNGEITVRQGSNDVVRINSDGFKYYDEAGVERISMGQDTAGRQQIIVYGEDGKAQILIGQDPKNDSPVVAVTETGDDVRMELLNDTTS